MDKVLVLMSTDVLTAARCAISIVQTCVCSLLRPCAVAWSSASKRGSWCECQCDERSPVACACRLHGDSAHCARHARQEFLARLRLSARCTVVSGSTRSVGASSERPTDGLALVFLGASACAIHRSTSVPLRHSTVDAAAGRTELVVLAARSGIGRAAPALAPIYARGLLCVQRTMSHLAVRERCDCRSSSATPLLEDASRECRHRRFG